MHLRQGNIYSIIGVIDSQGWMSNQAYIILRDDGNVVTLDASLVEIIEPGIHMFLDLPGEYDAEDNGEKF